VTVSSLLPAAERIARHRESPAIGADHLLLAIMCDESSPWARILDERGVGTYDTVRRAAAPLPSRADLGLGQARVSRCPKPMRRAIVDLAIGLVLLATTLLRRRARPAKVDSGLPLGQDARLAILIARQLADGEDVTAGHVLVALASIPGAQIKLLRREHQLVAAAARQALGLTRGRDRFLLTLRRPALAARRLERRLRADGGAGRTVVRLLMRACGLLWALTLFFVETTVTVGLYVFLWPALLLANGVRAFTGWALGVDFTVRRAHEIPGGEVEVHLSSTTSDLRAAGAILIPRAVCFAVCLSSMVVLLWQSSRLGVVPFPVTIARYDIVQGNVELAQLIAPLLILFDTFVGHGPVVGAGILAGIGAGLLAVPSFREMQMIRLAGGHDVGRGSRALRVVLAPFSGMTAVFACFEAIVPFRGGPLYLTVYALPLLLALALAAQVDPLLPY
jgi:hypothetical protein